MHVLSVMVYAILEWLWGRCEGILGTLEIC
jgi:hypothetical protein